MSDDQTDETEGPQVEGESTNIAEVESESARAIPAASRVRLSDPLLPVAIMEGALAQYAGMTSKPWIQAYAASYIAKDLLSAMQPALGLNLAQNFGSGIMPSAAITNVYRAMSTLTNPEGANVFAPALASLASVLAGIQDSARSALQAEFATKTQEFLTTDKQLRYRSNWPVWHYTNGHALLSILRTRQLWASSPQNLNDASEMTHGFGLIREAFSDWMGRARADELDDAASWGAVERTMGEVLGEEYVSNIIHDVYYISASTQKDSLTLWRNYADGDGFAIGIDASVGLSADGFAVDQADEAKDIRADIPLISGWYRVTYAQGSKQKLAQGFIQNAIEDIRGTGMNDLPELVRELQKQAIILASTMKDNAFKDEKEVRWITTNFTTFDPVHYEHGHKSIVPVLKVMTSSPEPEQPLPLKGMWCSPISAETIDHTVEGLLRQQGYLQASKKVERSKQPFRG